MKFFCSTVWVQTASRTCSGSLTGAEMISVMRTPDAWDLRLHRNVLVLVRSGPVWSVPLRRTGLPPTSAQNQTVGTKCPPTIQEQSGVTNVLIRSDATDLLNDWPAETEQPALANEKEAND